MAPLGQLLVLLIQPDIVLQVLVQTQQLWPLVETMVQLMSLTKLNHMVQALQQQLKH
jgi:hypothetical protein